MNFNFHISRWLINVYTRFSLYVIIGIAVILILIGYSTLIGPKWTEISSVGLNDYQNEQQNLEADQKYLAALKTLVTKYNAISQLRIAEIEKMVPTGDQLPALFVEMEAMVKDAGMVLDNVSFSSSTETTPATAGSLTTLNIDMDITGGSRYSDMKQLLDTVERNQRLLDLVSISFSLDEADVVAVEGGSSGTYSLSMRTYYLAELEEASSEETDLESLLEQLQNQNQEQQ